MRRFVLVLVLIVAGAAAGASQAAAPVQIKKIDISDSFTIPAPALCPFDVTLTTSGTANITLWLNDSGQVVREHDTSPGSKITYSANGKSFSFPNSVSADTDYGAGATLGSSATVTLTGMFGHVPGYIASDAGQLIIDATVVGFGTFNGVQVPLVDFVDLVSQKGNSHSNDDVTAAICAALS